MLALQAVEPLLRGLKVLNISRSGRSAPSGFDHPPVGLVDLCKLIFTEKSTKRRAVLLEPCKGDRFDNLPFVPGLNLFCLLPLKYFLQIVSISDGRINCDLTVRHGSHPFHLFSSGLFSYELLSLFRPYRGVAGAGQRHSDEVLADGVEGKRRFLRAPVEQTDNVSIA